MSVVLVERIPLPRLSTYVVLSVFLLAAAVLHIHQDDSPLGSPIFSQNSTSSSLAVTPLITAASSNSNSKDIAPVNSSGQSSLSIFESLGHFIDRFCQETWCLWSIINMSYCLLILAGKAIQNIVFGELRVPEHQHVREKFWNFIFYKFIFIFGVLNVQTLEEVLLWVGWFSVLGFLHLLTALTKARFEFLTFSPVASVNQHAKLLFLLCVVLLSCCILTTLCFLFSMDFFGHVMCFMLAEIFLLATVTLHVLLHYVIHLYVQHHNFNPNISETDNVTVIDSINPSVIVYYVDLILDTASLSMDLVHHLHMLVWSNIFLSMASLVVLIQLRYLYYELIKRIKRHRKYCELVRIMTSEFPIQEVTKETCAICWESVSSCRQLPCNHIFHDTCLRQWLEQDPSCPTCRAILTSLHPPPAPQAAVSTSESAVLSEQQTGEPGNQSTAARNVNASFSESAQTDEEGLLEEGEAASRSHFFRFDGFRFFSWLPSFHIEVSHMTGSGLSGAAVTDDVTTRQGLETAADHVQSMFPHLPQDAIIADLQRTGSTEVTVDNILEGHLALHAPQLPSGPMQVHLDALHSAPPNPAQDPASSSPPEHRGRKNCPSPLQAAAAGCDLFSSTTPLPGGARFSKSSNERESLLAQRKQRLLSTARRRFVGERDQQSGRPASGTLSGV